MSYHIIDEACMPHTTSNYRTYVSHTAISIYLYSLAYIRDICPKSLMQQKPSRDLSWQGDRRAAALKHGPRIIEGGNNHLCYDNLPETALDFVPDPGVKFIYISWPWSKTFLQVSGCGCSGWSDCMVTACTEPIRMQAGTV